MPDDLLRVADNPRNIVSSWYAPADELLNSLPSVALTLQKRWA